MTAQILQVDDDPFTLAQVGKLLRIAGYDVVTAKNGAEALARVDSILPDLIILDVSMPGIDGYEVCRQLRARPRFAHVPILMLTGYDTLDERLKGFDAGADNYLSKPVHAGELQILVRSLLQRALPEREMAQQRSARKIAVFSLRGGVGVSTIAVNLAAGLVQLWDGRATIVDLALTNGQIALMLDLPLHATWADLARMPIEQINSDTVLDVLLHHHSRVQVLAAPPRPQLGTLIRGEKITHVLTLLESYTPYLVIDMPHDFAEPTLAGLDAADQVVLVVAPEMAAVRAASCALRIFDALHYPPEKISLALNWTFERNGLARREIEASLGRNFDFVIPYAPELFSSVLHSGMPPVIGLPNSPLGALFEDIAFRLSSPEQRAQKPAQPSAAWLRATRRTQQRHL